VNVDPQIYPGSLGKKRQEREGELHDPDLKWKIQKVENQVVFDLSKVETISESSGEDLE